MNRQTFLHRLGLGFLATLFARESSATTELLPGAPDTADAVPAELAWNDNIAVQINGGEWTDIDTGERADWAHVDTPLDLPREARRLAQALLDDLA